MNKELVLENKGIHYSGLELVANEVGNWVIFQQSYPDMFSRHASEEFVLREQDIDKVIDFLQQAKKELSK